MKNKRNIIIAVIITLFILIAVGGEKKNSQEEVTISNIVNEKINGNNIIDEGDSNIFMLPDSVKEITSQGYYENVIRISGNYRNSDKVLYGEKLVYPRCMVIGLVLEKADKKKFINNETDVTDIINIIEDSLIITNSISESEDETLQGKFLILNAKAQYILSVITYTGNNQFNINIDYPEELENDTSKTVVIESDILLKKLQNIDV